jgi:hypothetical protein
VVTIPGTDFGDLKTVDLWWKMVEKRSAWVARSTAAVGGLPKGTPERSEASAIFKGCGEAFDQINLKLSDLLQTPNDGYIMRTWVRPALGLFGSQSPKKKKFDEVLERINDFCNRYESIENDQIIAAVEAISTFSDNLNLIRMKVAQWAFEELFRNFKLLELAVKVGGIVTPTTIDDLETEKLELVGALTDRSWNTVEREKYRRVFNRIRRAMDFLEFETEIKIGFNRAFGYATGHIGKTVSAIVILQNIEAVWQGLVDDSTLQEFWKSEQEALEEE